MTQIIDGKIISSQIKDELKLKTAQLKEQGIEIQLAVIQVETTLHLQFMSAIRKRLANT